MKRFKITIENLEENKTETIDTDAFLLGGLNYKDGSVEVQIEWDADDDMELSYMLQMTQREVTRAL